MSDVGQATPPPPPLSSPLPLIPAVASPLRQFAVTAVPQDEGEPNNCSETIEFAGSDASELAEWYDEEEIRDAKHEAFAKERRTVACGTQPTTDG